MPVLAASSRWKPIDAMWLYDTGWSPTGISDPLRIDCGKQFGELNGRPTMSHRRATICSRVGFGPPNGLVPKSARPLFGSVMFAFCVRMYDWCSASSSSSVKNRPYPPRMTDFSLSRYAKPSRGATLFLSVGRLPDSHGRNSTNSPCAPWSMS